MTDTVIVKARFVTTLQKLPGITAEIANDLYDAGFKTKLQVLNAPDADLKKVKNITQVKVNALKAHKAKLKEKPWEK